MKRSKFVRGVLTAALVFALGLVVLTVRYLDPSRSGAQSLDQMVGNDLELLRLLVIDLASEDGGPLPRLSVPPISSALLKQAVKRGARSRLEAVASRGWVYSLPESAVGRRWEELAPEEPLIMVMLPESKYRAISASGIKLRESDLSVPIELH